MRLNRVIQVARPAGPGREAIRFYRPIIGRTLARVLAEMICWRNAHASHDRVDWKYHHVGRYLLSNVPPPKHGQI